ncbi:nuclear pore glycoprotein p62-like [Rhipicephalus microplus]|uniref:nuclear pore glycoprotein p62-like n=1 Tax=Rhipicephalus microplus TaxID=6941 RepID=UPI003F6B393C
MLGSSTTTSFTFGTPAAATTSFSFGTNKPSTTFNFGTPQPLTGLTSAPAAATAVPATTTTATAVTTQAPAQTAGTAASSSTMHYRLLEESVNQWKLELEELERNFIDQATQVNAWDRSLLSSAERVGQLSSLVEHAQLDQQRLEHELDYVAAQQGELERLLAPLEAAMKQAPALSVQQHADLEREHTYHMAENINSQLNSVSRDIKDIVEQLNAANAFTAQDKPLQQISKVLNSHMDALMWVQHNSGVLQQKLQELERACQQQRADPLLKR